MHYEVKTNQERNEIVARLKRELGGVWASGVGNSYPEDYTVMDRYGYTSIRTGDKGGNKTIATIQVG